MAKPLVTLITPCFNGAENLRPYLNGVLSQTYPNVQYIFVNDGSTDDTENIIMSVADKIRAKGWDFVYIKQPNGGQAAAVNNALQHVKGKYFSQIDSDDIIYPEYLEKYCEFLETHPDCKFCYARVAIAREDDIAHPYRIQFRKITNDATDNLFQDFIDIKNVPPLAFYMANTAAFRKVVKLPFYENRGGQNWQILLPLSYHYKCGYIDEVLASCIERSDSHSHTYDKNRTDKLKQILFNTISRLDISDGEKHFWYDRVTNNYLSTITHKKVFMLFNFIPFITIKQHRVYLFGFIRIGKIKGLI